MYNTWKLSNQNTGFISTKVLLSNIHIGDHQSWLADFLVSGGKSCLKIYANKAVLEWIKMFLKTR